MRSLLIVLHSMLCVVPLWAAAGSDIATNQKMIVGTWYCPSSTPPQRLEIDNAGVIKWYSYSELKGPMKYWSLASTSKYAFKSAMQIHSEFFDMDIRSLTPDKLVFVSTGIESTCGHDQIPGDTPESRTAAEAELTREKRVFLGKWTSTKGNEYVEFLSGDKCILGSLKAGKWTTTPDVSDVLHGGTDAQCGGNGIYSHDKPNTLVLDYGMGGDTTTFHRASSTKSAP